MEWFLRIIFVAGFGFLLRWFWKNRYNPVRSEDTEDVVTEEDQEGP
jgi:hypothetical protein